MRPRGESGSWASSAYVGQLGRQRPQCTHWRSSPYSSSERTPDRPAPALDGLAGVATGIAVVMSSPSPSDPAHEAARVENTLRVELGLQPLHEAEARPWRVPYRARFADAERRPLNDEVAVPSVGGGAPPGEDGRGDSRRAQRFGRAQEEPHHAVPRAPH